MLERYGFRRIQRSAFLGETTYARARDVARACKMIIDEETDVVHVFPVSSDSWRRTIVVGTPKWSAGAPGNAVFAY